MKGNRKLLVTCLLSAMALVSFVGCDQPSTSTSSTSSVSLESVKTTAVTTLTEKVASIDKNAYTDEDLETLFDLQTYGELFIQNATSPETVADNLNVVMGQIEKFESETQKLASGVYSFVASSYELRTQILGALEKYAVDNFLTGISFMDDGGYSLYRPEVQRGVTNYITGYGWGTLSDGNITADLATETNPAWKRYYHSFLTDDPGQINYGDDKGSVVGDLIGYMASGYWGTRINETKDGYEWYADLAKEMPQPVNEIGSTGLATTYSWKLKTGADGLKYNTLTKDANLAKYAGRGVAAEDYLTSYKMLFTKKHNWARGGETLSGAGSIKGTEKYYNASVDGYTDELWNENMGIKVETVDGEAVMTVEFNVPCSSFYAMYYMASSIHSPVPMDFIKELGGGDFATGAALYQKTNLAKGYTPVDTSLSCGPYVLEAWEADKTIVFKKNELFNFNLDGRYQIPGVHYNILEAANTDPEAGLKEFLAGKIHACGIPSTQLDKYKNLNDPAVGYAVYNPGGSNFKLNVNACDQETWEYLFGKDGVVSPTPEEDYWECEPALSNRNFLKGLSYSINRKEFGESKGVGPSIDFFGDAYLSDPENGVAYNDTKEHEEAIKELTATNEYGYDVETAKAYFRKALEELVAEGAYKSGETITIEMAWQSQSQYTTYGDPISQYFHEAFDSVGAEFGIKLETVNWSSAVWSDVYYAKMMVGQFDIGFGSVSGNTLNPLNFLEVLKSDNSSGFTLNWGCDTNKVEVEYNGELWSFDSLWQAAETGGYFEKGLFKPFHDAEVVKDSLKQDADGKVTLVVDANILELEGIEATVTSIVLSGYKKDTKYAEFVCDFVKTEDGNYLVTLDADGYELFTTNNYYEADGNEVMIDVYYDCTVLEVPSEQYDTAYVLLDDIIVPAE
jgi:hypothetical protein